MSGARFNLVRVDTLEATEGVDQDAASTVYDRRDEVELVTPLGEPASMADAPSWIDQDIRYDYIDGSVGSSARRSRHVISLAVDYLGNATRAKLERWQRDRALVQFNPGYGRETELAYRPLPGAGLTYVDGTTSLYDLTGRNWLGVAGDSTNTMVWDDDEAIMRGPFTGSLPRRVVPTKYGAVQVFERAKVNRHRPGYPASATPGHGASDAGWTKGGTAAGDINFALVNSGNYMFGHSDCPDSLRVTTTFANYRTRVVSASSQWDSGSGEYHYGFTGSGTAAMSIWLRGRFSAAAYIEFGQSGGDIDSVNLGGLDLSQWTRFSLSAYSADWTSAPPLLRIWISSGETADSDDFYIGPLVVCQDSGQVAQKSPEWAPYNASVVSGSVVETGFQMPLSGSMVSAFYLPVGADHSATSLIGYTDASGSLGFDTSGNAYFTPSSSDALGGSVSLREGEINTLAATWSSGGSFALYCNGSLIDTTSTGGRECDIGSTSASVYFGRNASGSYSSWPLGFMSGRIDSRVFTPAEMAQIDASLRDPAANLISVQARGRKYRIVQIPSTPRNQPGGAQWIGNLVLEEWEYDSNLADITTAEVV
jgi:hypothetical protein